MRAKGNKKTKVNIVTLGCSKNLVDSEVLLTQLRGNNIDAVHESKKDDASIVVINTCGFIDNAKQESIDTILRYVDAKEEGIVEKVYVTGCLSQRYKEDLEKEIPMVDAWFGTRDLSRLLKQLNANYKHELVGERILTNPHHYAYLKISEGCDRPCSFCRCPEESVLDLQRQHTSCWDYSCIREVQKRPRQVQRFASCSRHWKHTTSCEWRLSNCISQAQMGRQIRLDHHRRSYMC